MSSENPLFTSADLEKATSIVNKFTDGQEEVLPETKQLFVDKAKLLNSGEDNTARIFRIASIKNELLEKVSYMLLYGIQERKFEPFGRMMVLELHDANFHNGWPSVEAEFSNAFLASVRSDGITRMPDFFNLPVGEFAAENNDFSVSHIERIF